MHSLWLKAVPGVKAYRTNRAASAATEPELTAGPSPVAGHLSPAAFDPPGPTAPLHLEPAFLPPRPDSTRRLEVT